MFSLNCAGRLLVVDKPLVMGILNTTPDSFYPGSRLMETDQVLREADRMLSQGATFVDLGGQSTRPGSRRLTADEELARVIGPLEAVCRQFPEAFVSVDTYYARVAREAVQAGACLVNDISAGRLDPDLLVTVSELRVPYVLMHMQGTPEDMQAQPHYQDVTREVLDFFIGRLGHLRDLGITDVVLDPGFGFGKTIRHNLTLLRNLGCLDMLERPLLVGLSRKSMVYKTLGVPVEASLNGTTVLHTLALAGGASILRVHDVKEALETIRLFEAWRTA
ncbi:MAG TPA: dihydropteroate synthase [Chitinophagaceae bacterium]|nr:dihydropteroate synthase [Chitinophagaceae bacterium]